VLEAMPPFMGGGEMIEHVGLDVSTYAPPPSRFEPGTPPIAEAIGMGAAADYLGGMGLQAVRAYEEDIGRYLYERVRAKGSVRADRVFCTILVTYILMDMIECAGNGNSALRAPLTGCSLQGGPGAVLTLQRCGRGS
jgi:selenocysteine lyase/cysteine desulfurase